MREVEGSCSKAQERALRGVFRLSAHCVLGRPGHGALHVLVHLILTMALEVGLTTTIPIIKKTCVSDLLAHGCISWAGST